MHQASNRLILLKPANERKNLTNPALLQLRSWAQIMSLSIGSVSLVGFGGSVGETKFTIITKCLPERTAVISQHYLSFPHNMTSEVENEHRNSILMISHSLELRSACDWIMQIFN